MGAFIDKTLETFELMAVAITELRQRVEALEAEKIHMTKVPEIDRSHDVVIGARVDSSHTGV